MNILEKLKRKSQWLLWLKKKTSWQKKKREARKEHTKTEKNNEFKPG
jgi:hypothetical protein